MEKRRLKNLQTTERFFGRNKHWQFYSVSESSASTRGRVENQRDERGLYLVDFEKFDVSRTTMPPARNESCFPNSVSFTDASTTLFQGSLKDRRKWPGHGEKWKSTQYLIRKMSKDRHLSARSSFDNERKIRGSSFGSPKVAYYRCPHFSRTGKNDPSGATMETVNERSNLRWKFKLVRDFSLSPFSLILGPSRDIYYVHWNVSFRI